eukprot:179306_1
MHSKSTKCVTNSLIHNLSNTHKYNLFCTHIRYANGSTSQFGNISGLHGSRDTNITNESSAVERELLGLERDDKIDIQNDPRTEPDFPEIRVPGPRSKNTEYKSKTKHLNNKRVYNRAGIEKPHAHWGWSPFNERKAEQWNWKDNNKPNKDIPESDKQDWANASCNDELLLLNDGSNNKYYNPNDLTTFEGYSESCRSATFKTALNVGVHWGKDKSLWNTSMAPYLKGVVNGRHVFDITLIISNLRKMIRLLQSLIMDECNILFVCNSRDVEMRTLARIMCTRINMPLLDDKYANGSLTNWNHMAEHFRGPGRELMDGKKPSSRIWRKTKLHRMIREAPDFIFLFNRSFNDTLCYEANRMQIPVGSLCDSDDSTREIQYVIPCNTQSIQSVHFILDMLTRGILEAQSKMDSIWWSKQKDLEIDRNALYDVEMEWQYKYDPYQQSRIAGKFMAGEHDNELDIATTYVKQDQDVMESIENQQNNKNIVLAKYGNVHAQQSTPESMKNDDVTDFSSMDNIEKSRMDKLKGVLDNRSTEYQRRYNENQEKENINQQYVNKFDLPKKFQTTSDFAMGMLQDHVTSQAKQRQRISSMTTGKKL